VYSPAGTMFAPALSLADREQQQQHIFTPASAKPAPVQCCAHHCSVYGAARHTHTHAHKGAHTHTHARVHKGTHIYIHQEPVSIIFFGVTCRLRYKLHIQNPDVNVIDWYINESILRGSGGGGREILGGCSRI
jgi:hypothetical protein